jgi:hypothetical protein
MISLHLSCTSENAAAHGHAGIADAAGGKQKCWLPVSRRSVFSGDCPAAGRVLAGLNPGYKSTAQ